MFNKRKARPAEDPRPAVEDEHHLLEDIETRGGKVNFGAPTRCPSCGDFGFVESVSAGVQSNRCMHCGATWEFTRKGLESYLEESRAREDEPKAQGKGVLVQGAGLNALRVTREQFISLSRALRDTRNIKKPPRD